MSRGQVSTFDNSGLFGLFGLSGLFSQSGLSGLFGLFWFRYIFGQIHGGS